MDVLEKPLVFRLHIVVEKLQKLECSLLGNSYEVWVMELLFKPAIHRYNLMEWMLSKLDYNMDEICKSTNSVEEKMEFLEAAVLELGFLGENSLDVIRGTASVEKQLKFWTAMTDILWTDYKINSDFSLTDTDEGVALSQSHEKCLRNISEVYEGVCTSVNNICESVNLKHLFYPNVHFLPPDVKKEIEHIPSEMLNKHLPSLQDLKAQAKEKNPCANPKEVYETLSSNKVMVDESLNYRDSTDHLNKLEDGLSKISLAIKNLACGDFNDVYTDLKPLIQHVKPDEFKDVGPEFGNTLPLLKNMLQVKELAPKLKESNDSFIKVKGHVDDLLTQYHLEDSKSSNIAHLLQEEN